MKIGLQLYTLREAAEVDFEEVLKKVSEQGYEGVELAGTYGLTAEELKKMLEKYNLKPISAHVPLEELTGNLEASISYYKTVGCQTVVLPYLTEEYRYGTMEFSKVMNNIKEIGKACEEKGLHFAYHNHDFEFAKTDQGTYVLDDMYRQVLPEYLQAELDTCWVEVAGESAVDYINRYKGRCGLVHIKDYKREDQQVVLTPLGKGVINLKAVVEAALKCGVEWLIVEQDDHQKDDPVKNTQISMDYLKEII